MFDKDAFLNQTVESANDTRMQPVPEGEYTASIISVESDIVGANNLYILKVTWEIDDPELQKNLGRKRITTRQAIFPDVDDDGRLKDGPGDNVRLGKLRAAVGQNEKGRPWKPLDLEGAGPAKIVVTHRADKANDELIDRGEEPIFYDQVAAVSKI